MLHSVRNSKTILSMNYHNIPQSHTQALSANSSVDSHVSNAHLVEWVIDSGVDQ